MSLRNSLLFIFLTLPFFAISQNDIQVWTRDANGVFHPDNQNIDFNTYFQSFDLSLSADTCLSVESVFYTGKTENKTVLHWRKGDTTSITYLLRYRQILDTSYTYKVISDTTAILSGLTECTDYIAGVSSVCIQDTSGFKSISFRTTCKSGNKATTDVVKNILFPNPAKENITLEIPQNTESISNISIWNSLGVQLTTFKITENTPQFISLPISALPPGQYYIRLQGKSRAIISNFIKL